MKMTHIATVTLLAVVTLAESYSNDERDRLAIAVTSPRVGTVSIPSENGVARRIGQVIQISIRNFPADQETAQWFRRTPAEGNIRLQVDLFDRSGAPIGPGEFRLAGSADRQAVLRITDHLSSSIVVVPPDSTGLVTVRKIDSSGISGSISFTSPDTSVNGSFKATFN